MRTTIQTFLIVSSLYLFGAGAVAQETGFDSGTTPLLPEEKVEVTPETTALMDNLQEQLGLTNNQAVGALGSMFAFARNALNEDTYRRLEEVLPGINRLQEGDLIQGISGDDLKDLGSLQELRQAFEAVGLNPRATEQFTTAILDYLAAQGVEQALRGQLQELWSTRPPL